MSATERAVATYLRALGERDPAARAALLAECFAANGRLVTRGRTIRGPAELAEEMGRWVADPELVSIRLVSAIDARGTTFRYRGVACFRDGTSAESFDAGEVDADGRIALLLTFAGPLGDAEPGAWRFPP